MNDPRQQSHPQGLPKTSSVPTIPKMAEPNLDPIALDDDLPPMPPPAATAPGAAGHAFTSGGTSDRLMP